MFQLTSQMKSYLDERENIWMKENILGHLCSLFYFLFLFGGNITVLFDAHCMPNKRSDGQAGKVQTWKKSWTTVNVVDQLTVDTVDRAVCQSGVDRTWVRQSSMCW